MPKEQAHFGERVPRGTSKNAKDKSNCATLRASLDATHRDQEGIMGMSGRLSRYDSEKDSGYSEAGSDSLQADLDDQRSSVSEPHRAHSSSSSSSSSRSSTGHSMPTYEDQLSPIYVIKNMVVKPSVREQLLHSPVAWGGGWHDLSGAKTPTQLLLIPQLGVHTPTPAPAPTPSNLLEPQGQSKKGGSRSNKNHGSKNSYLPIFNSYPRIAPHPRKEGPELGRAGAGAGGVKESGSEGQSLSKRVCTEDKREAVSTTTQLKPQQQQQQQQREGRPHSYSHNNVSSSHSSSPQPPHRSLGGHASSTQQRSHCCHQKPNRSPSPSLSNSVGSPSVSSSQTPSPPSYSNSTSSSSASSSTAVSPHRVSPEAPADSLSDSLSDCSSTRQRRFLNTTEILSQSGLLAITLRTKELLRQNAATERDLAQLRQHAQLLCLAAQAAQTGQENPQQGPNESPSPLDKLLQAMAQSGRYPSLDWAQLKAQGHHRAEKGDKAEKEKDNHGYNNNNNNNNNDNYDRPSQNPAPVSRGHRDDYTAPPSPLFAPSPAPEETDHGGGAFFNPHSAISGPRPASEQGGRQGINAKPMCDLIMPPDSSTHQYLL